VTTIADLLREAAQRLAAAGIDNARLDARLLLGEAVGREVWPHESAPVGPESIGRFESLLGRRMAREPVSRILGRRAFWTLDLLISPDTLDPRADSEALIEAAITAFAGRPGPRRILDLGTGTGCLLLAALQAFPGAIGLGIDRSAGAVEIARANAVRHGLEARASFAVLDWDDMSQDAADLVLSNPPYVEEATIDALEPEVARYDPRSALSGGRDGLDAYRGIVRILPRIMAVEGFAVLELGAGQRRSVVRLAEIAGFTTICTHRDLGGVERALVLKRNDTLDERGNTN